jgi:hypothetical protein
MEDDLNLFKNVGRPKIVESGRQPQKNDTTKNYQN